MRLRSLTAPVALLLSACYVNVPRDSGARPIAAGDQVALDISDQGRLGLTERFGAGVSQIEGRLKTLSEQSFELQVSRVSYLRDADSQWSGETVVIERQHVGRVYERRLSRSRTLTAAAAVGGGLVAFIVTRALVGSGRERDPETEPTGPQQVRMPRSQTSP